MPSSDLILFAFAIYLANVWFVSYSVVDDLFVKIQLYKTQASFIQNFINNIIFVLTIFLEKIFFYILRKFYNLNLVMRIIKFYDSL